MTNDRMTFTQWLVEEAKRGFTYQNITDASAAFEAAGYSWGEWVQTMNPTVNLNGTSGEELLRQVNAVLDALRTSERAMVEAAPHGRDYQHDMTGDAYRKARTEHIQRLRIVHDLVRQYEGIQESIDNQMLEREAARNGRMRR